MEPSSLVEYLLNHLTIADGQMLWNLRTRGKNKEKREEKRREREEEKEREEGGKGREEGGDREGKWWGRKEAERGRKRWRQKRKRRRRDLVTCNVDPLLYYMKIEERERERGEREDYFHWPPLHGVLWWLCWALQACITSIVPSSLWGGRKERDEGREKGEREGYNWIAQQLSVSEWSRFTVKVTW